MEAVSATTISPATASQVMRDGAGGSKAGRPHEAPEMILWRDAVRLAEDGGGGLTGAIRNHLTIAAVATGDFGFARQRRGILFRAKRVDGDLAFLACG